MWRLRYWPRLGACPSRRRCDSTPTLSSPACAILPGSSVCAISVWVRSAPTLPSPSAGEGRCCRSDFFEEIRPEEVKVLVVGVRVEQPCSRRDTAQERIAVLWGEAKACDLMPIAHGERRD